MKATLNHIFSIFIVVLGIWLMVFTMSAVSGIIITWDFDIDRSFFAERLIATIFSVIMSLGLIFEG